ncbi:MAG: cytochrome c family protein [Magnetospirillum sp. WYHS-4]
MRASVIAVAALLMLAPLTGKAEPASFEGARVCIKCHDRQGEEWKKTAHAKALESLRPGQKAEAKGKAKLDPAKDYTQDKDCLACHVTGYGQPGGYAPGVGNKNLEGVGCESCHGAGSLYRLEHGDAENRLKRSGETSDRKRLVGAGQNFDYEQACARCHLNHHGSPGARAPFSPFTPALDSKYHFDFAKAVKVPKGVHAHFKLGGVFKGEPVPEIRADMQRTAKGLDDE